jgi:hypothetical protein
MIKIQKGYLDDVIFHDVMCYDGKNIEGMQIYVT